MDGTSGGSKPPIFSTGKKEGDHPKYKKGTTALGFVFKDRVMLAVDHSVYSSSKWLWPQNVVVLNSHTLATISGGSEYLLTDLQKKCHEYELREGTRASAAQASKWLADTLSSNREEGLSVGVLIAGWDGLGFFLYHVDSKEGKVRNGSGSRYAFDFLIADVKSYFSMTLSEAVFVAEKGLCLASYRAPERP
ncbi:OLC1v1012423C1 [Oldenlandia corymbosa var. corymbosa]|uniref:OLC1v1012423C1 n=1 Tax=Oldenlandia corymbosa var. corymbosa TaxID=529605 RepID=A0AAV1DXQ8_OLDCO|nr:OLC1v1012423C1 [Oldenlandia corymbosa var. corymbosa]